MTPNLCIPAKQPFYSVVNKNSKGKHPILKYSDLDFMSILYTNFLNSGASVAQLKRQSFVVFQYPERRNPWWTLLPLHGLLIHSDYWDMRVWLWGFLEQYSKVCIHLLFINIASVPSSRREYHKYLISVFNIIF